MFPASFSFYQIQEPEGMIQAKEGLSPKELWMSVLTREQLILEIQLQKVAIKQHQCFQNRFYIQKTESWDRHYFYCQMLAVGLLYDLCQEISPIITESQYIKVNGLQRSILGKGFNKGYMLELSGKSSPPILTYARV